MSMSAYSSLAQVLERGRHLALSLHVDDKPRSNRRPEGPLSTTAMLTAIHSLLFLCTPLDARSPRLTPPSDSKRAEQWPQQQTEQHLLAFHEAYNCFYWLDNGYVASLGLGRGLIGCWFEFDGRVERVSHSTPLSSSLPLFPLLTTYPSSALRINSVCRQFNS